MSDQWTLSKRFGFPDRDTDRKAWNDAFECYIKEIGEHVVLTRPPADDKAMEEILIMTRIQQTDLLVLQKQLTERSLACFAMADFESKWANAGTPHQNDILLEGMVRTSSTNFGAFEDMRQFCDEATLPRLLQDKGQGFMRLLRAFILKEGKAATQPFLLPSARFDRMIKRGRHGASAGEKAIQLHYTLLRNDFLCEFVFSSFSISLTRILRWCYLHSSLPF